MCTIYIEYSEGKGRREEIYKNWKGVIRIIVIWLLGVSLRKEHIWCDEIISLQQGQSITFE